MKYSGKTFDISGRIIRWVDGKYVQHNWDYYKKPLPMDTLGMPLLTWKWFETGLLDDLSTQELRNELAHLLEIMACWMCSVYGGYKERPPDYLGMLRKEYLKYAARTS